MEAGNRNEHTQNDIQDASGRQQVISFADVVALIRAG